MIVRVICTAEHQHWATAMLAVQFCSPPLGGVVLLNDVSLDEPTLALPCPIALLSWAWPSCNRA